MKGYKTISIASAVLATMTAGGQTLTEEVVIERDITPVVRTANRPAWVTPTLLTPKVEMKRLSFNEYVDAAEITRTVPQLDPVEWADSVMRTPYRGYAALGYFPVFNLGASAGYRFIRTSKANVGAHLSYEGASWNGWDGEKEKNERNKIALGVDGTARFGAGTLKADINYAYSSTGKAYYPASYDRGNQALNTVRVTAGWQPSKLTRIGWNVGAEMEYGGFSKNKTQELPLFNTHTERTFEFYPVKDMTLGLKSDLAYRLGAEKTSEIALGVGIRFRHTNCYNTVEPARFYSESWQADYATVVPKAYGAQTMGTITLRPGYKFVKNSVSGRIGVQFDINTGGMRKGVYLAPDVEVQWAPTQRLAVYLKAKGGERMNTNTDLWERNPWMTGVFAYERSHVNADVEIGVTYGSYKGMWATLHGGWASASDWLCPVIIENVNMWGHSEEFNGFHAGLQIGYAWKDIVTVAGNAEIAQHGKYYKWQDNAKYALGVEAKVRPMAKLELNVGYDTRLDRKSVWLKTIPTATSAYYQSEWLRLGSTSNLFVGGEYEITPALSGFLKVENLLNRHWNVTSYVRSPGIRGLLGVQLKF